MENLLFLILVVLILIFGRLGEIEGLTRKLAGEEKSEEEGSSIRIGHGG